MINNKGKIVAARLCLLGVGFGLLSYSTIASGLTSDRKLPIMISSGQAICQRNNYQDVCHYDGNVKFDQGTSHLRAAHVTLYKKNGRITKMVAIGKRARFCTEQDGNHQVITAMAETIELFPVESLVTLAGNGEVTEGNNQYHGPLVKYYFGHLSEQAVKNKVGI